MSKARRFISGAVCPSCREVDRTVIEPVAAESSLADLDDLATESIQRRCVACGFVEALQPGQTAVNAPLPRARYERSRETTARATPVRIIDPSASKPS
ncbi:MAG: hypothetical protein VW867_03205 [Gammaproteobacteria bacterium]